MRPEYSAPYDEAIIKASKIGLNELELMVGSRKEMELYWTKREAERLKHLLKESDMIPLQICLFQNTIGNLASLDQKDVEESLENFRKAAALAHVLGTEIIGFPAPCPDKYIRSRTSATLPEYFFLNPPDMIMPGEEARDIKDWRFDAKFRLYFSERFDWERLWEAFIKNMNLLMNTAAQEGVYVRIENRYNSMASHTDSLLRLLKAVDHPRLSATLNTAQAFMQREILPWAIHRYGRYLTHIHACDGDGLACYNLPVGEGIIDWEGVLIALDEIGYEGTLSFDWLNDPDCEEHVAESMEYLDKKSRK